MCSTRPPRADTPRVYHTMSRLSIQPRFWGIPTCSRCCWGCKALSAIIWVTVTTAVVVLFVTLIVVATEGR